MAGPGPVGCLGFILVLFGVLLFLRVALVGGAAFLALAIGLGAAYYAGVAGRWALGVAVALLLLAIPWFVLRLFGLAFEIAGLTVMAVFKLLPLALVAVGVYLLIRAFR